MASIDIILLAVLVGSVFLAIVLLVWYLLDRKRHSHAPGHTIAEVDDAIPDTLMDLNEELHDEGREELEKAVSENAAYIQQDVRRATSELNGYMQQEITRTLNEELKKYSDSANEVNQIAIDFIAKTQAALQEQQIQLNKQLAEQVAAEKERLLTQFEENMTEVVSHYVTTAIGDQIDVKDQLDLIISELQDNKQLIIEDLRSDA